MSRDIRTMGREDLDQLNAEPEHVISESDEQQFKDDVATEEYLNDPCDTELDRDLEERGAGFEHTWLSKQEETVTAIVPKHEFSKALALDSVTFGKNRLTIDADITTEELREVLKFVASAESAGLFWTGDILSHIKRTSGEDAARAAANAFSDPQLAWSSMLQAEQLTERFALRWQHHKAAWEECGNNKDALYWLAVAEEERWGVSTLRQEIRRATGGTARAEGNLSKGLKTITGEIIKFRKTLKAFTESKPLTEWTPKEVEAFIEDTTAIKSIIAKVESAWQKISPPLVRNLA